MKFSLKTIVLTLAIATLVGASSMIAGPCPTFESDVVPARLNHTQMGGLWYEYAFTSDYTEDMGYDCASWNMLAHATNDSFLDTKYEVLHHSMNMTNNKTAFHRMSMTCGQQGTPNSQYCSFAKQEAPTIVHKMTTHKPRGMQIISTDMNSHLVASMCYEYGLFHYIDYLVLTREKQPGMYIRGKVLKALKEKAKFTDEQVQAMTKGLVYECWGEDRFL